MRKKHVEKAQIGSAEYVILHALWRAKRGRRPSMSYAGIANPVMALRRAKEDYETKDMMTVFMANPYRHNELGSLGTAAYMLLRQYQFPWKYTEADTLVSADSDRCLAWDYSHASRCFKEHTGTGELGFERWLDRATDEQVMNFLIDILKLSPTVAWVGYRVMGSVHRGNGYPVWSFSVFAKHPDSDIELYTGPDAPNVKKDESSDRKTSFAF